MKKPKPPRKPRPKIPINTVLEWLQQNHPALHDVAEVDRNWVWLSVDLRGDNMALIREAIKEQGFVYHNHGGHLLPSGALGNWANACEHPIRFKRKGKGNGPVKAGDNSNGNNQEEVSEIEKAALDFINE